MPSHHVDGSTSQERYAFGTTDQSPAPPPLPPAIWPRLPSGPNGHVLVPTPVPTYGVHDPSLLNVEEGLTRCSAPTTWPRGRRVRPAGLKKIALAASSAGPSPPPRVATPPPV